MKFSIILPVYNVEKYIDKCLDSLKRQSYSNFEVIIVNDGSLDDSQKIIDKYVLSDKRFKSYLKENGGLSSARNFGLNYVNGDYLLFVDSDDYLDINLLKRINDTVVEFPVDVVRFNCVTEDEDGNILFKENNVEYYNKKMDEVIQELITRQFVEAACFYCYKVCFWNKYNFKFNIGRLHEDYGLIPLVLYYANTITSLNYVGYHYLKHNGSITKTNDYKNIVKKSFDTYYQYCDMVKKLSDECVCIKKQAILTYLTECLIFKGKWLKGNDYNEYYNRLKKNKVYCNIATYNFKKIIKKYVAFISFKLYLVIFK